MYYVASMAQNGYALCAAVRLVITATAAAAMALPAWRALCAARRLRWWIPLWLKASNVW